MRYLGRRWYIYAFAAVMAFAAGASMEWQCEGYTAAAISAIGEMSGAGLLRLSGIWTAVCGYAVLNGGNS